MKSFKELQVFVEQQIQEESRRIKTFSPANLYEPIGYTLDMGGKRLRPVLALLAYNMFRDDLEQVIPAALAIEIFHNFTLLHDDIMDKADVRRNQPTVHKKYSENVAILSGDAMSILAYQYLLKSLQGICVKWASYSRKQQSNLRRAAIRHGFRNTRQCLNRRIPEYDPAEDCRFAGL
jgi:geranylgeranyl diphosphate synthase type II